MKDKNEALLAVQTLRNLIVAATLLVTGLGQVLGRIFVILTTDENLQKIAYYGSVDPISSPSSFAAPEVKAGLATAVLLLSFGAFAQSARLAVHMSFMFRVAPVAKGDRLKIQLQRELIEMTHRVSVTFTTGIRLVFLFAILSAWCMGVTAFAVFGVSSG